jgi:nucleoside-diphosphate-sugar epimerase
MILVTGAGGFIGRQVCALLTRQHADVLAIDRNFSVPLPCQTFTADLTSPDSIPRLFQEYRFEAVIHLASLLKTASLLDPREAVRVNIGASLDLLKQAARNGVPRFIYGSSISAYGTKRFSEFGAVSESAPVAPEDVYGASKRFVEITGESYRRHAGLQFVALRISTVLGAGAHSKTSNWRSQIFEKLSSRQPAMIDLPYLAGEILPLVHVEEVAEVILHLFQASQVAHVIYNDPSENWVCEELARCVSAISDKITFRFGQSQVTGTPQAIDGNRFIEEFDARLVPLQKRLEEAADQRSSHGKN